MGNAHDTFFRWSRSTAVIAPLNRIPIGHITGSKGCPVKTFARGLTYLSRRMVRLRSGGDVN
jgi:hypothetical protein